MGSGFKNFTAASILTAADVNNFLMEQSVMSFASTGARDTQITAPEEGMTAFLNTGDRTEGLYTYTAGAWREARIPVPGFSATKTSAQAVTANAFTVVTWNSETYDHGSVFASNTFTVPTGYAGKWLLIANVAFDTLNNGDNKAAFITRQASGGGAPTSADAIAAQGYMASSSFLNSRSNLSVIHNAAVGDLFKVCVLHDSLSNINVLASAAGVPNFFQATWLGT
jgi:hypothetical protein